MEVFAAVSVCCLGKHDDHAALFYSCLCCGHTLYRLVNVLIQRVTAVGGDDDVCRDCVHLTLGSQELTAYSVSQVTVTCYREDRIMGCVNDNIDDEIQSCCSCCVQHIVVDRVALDHTSAGVRVCDEAGVVVVHNRFTACDTRKHALSAAGKACEEVRLNEARRLMIRLPPDGSFPK